MEINPKTFLDDVITLVRSLPEYSPFPSHVDEYEGEYDGDDWTEKHTSAFFEITGLFPSSRDSSKLMIKPRIEFVVYVGAKLNIAPHPLEFASAVIDAIEGQEFIYDAGSFRGQLISMNLYAVKKTFKIYMLRFQILA